MRYLEITATPDPAAVPPAFDLIAASASVTEARLVEWNPAAEGAISLLYAIEGDRSAVAAGLRASPLVSGLSISPVDGDRFLALLSVQPGADPTVGQLFEAVTGGGLIVLKPVVYRDGAVHLRVLGPEAVVQTFVEALPASLSVSIDAVRHAPRPGTAGRWGLPARQRAVLRAAVEAGYYEHPRATTHAEIASALDLAPSTVSEHLKKAEARLVRAAFFDAA